MRAPGAIARRALACGALAFAACGAFACIDLFHSTDFESRCDEDAAACGPVDAAGALDVAAIDGAPTGPTNFCAWDPVEARAEAVHACVWLGACAGPLGDDALGPCLMHATLAYDCAANPNRPVIGAAHAYWDCLAHVKSCDDVTRCLEPSGLHETCAEADAGYVACDPQHGTILACAAGPSGSAASARASCIASGQACAASGTQCSGSSTACGAESVGPSCDSDGTRLHDCDPDGGALDYGVDCASFGAGRCVASAGACAASGEAGTCTPTRDVTCDGAGVARGCPSGALEQIDCLAILGDGGACDPSAPGRPWDVSRACSAGNCGSDTCDGSTLTSCARGAIVSVDCATEGFSKCEPVSYPGDAIMRARCAN